MKRVFWSVQLDGQTLKNFENHNEANDFYDAVSKWLLCYKGVLQLVEVTF